MNCFVLLTRHVLPTIYVYITKALCCNTSHLCGTSHECLNYRSIIWNHRPLLKYQSCTCVLNIRSFVLVQRNHCRDLIPWVKSPQARQVFLGRVVEPLRLGAGKEGPRHPQHGGQWVDFPCGCRPDGLMIRYSRCLERFARNPITIQIIISPS